MFTFLKPYSKSIVIALTLMAVELVVELWHPLLMKIVIDEGIMKQDLSAVIRWGGLMVGIALIGFAAGIINSFFSSYVSQHFGYDIRTKLFERIQGFSFAAYQKFPTSGLITRMTSDVNQLQNVVFMGLRIAPRAPLMMVGALIMALLIDVRMAAVLLVAVPICIAVLIWMMKKGFGLFRAVQNQLDTTNGIVRENLIGMRLIKAFVRYKREISRFTDNNEQLMDRTIRALRLIEMTIPMLLLLMNIGILLILWFGNWQLQSNHIEEGSVVAIVIYATRITAMFSMLSFILMSIARAKASAGRIQEVLQAEDEGDAPAAPALTAGQAEKADGRGRSKSEAREASLVNERLETDPRLMAKSKDRMESAGGEASVAAIASEAAASAANAPESPSSTARFADREDSVASITEGEVLFDRVTFRYPGTGEAVLRDISFLVPAGRTVAVMGATGSGKSSLFQLIPRLYELDKGGIYIDGTDIRSMPVEQLRDAIGVVPQEVILFTGTVADNIRWGKNDASTDDVVEAAKHAQIHETIMELAHQYDTVVGQKGVNLSGGQKQRLSIARALIRKPKLLLLDDSTSALDLKTEARLLKALKQYSCTTLIITQKVSTAMNADSVILLDHGEVLAQGIHSVLVKSSELYRQIVMSQFGEKAVVAHE